MNNELIKKFEELSKYWKERSAFILKPLPNSNTPHYIAKILGDELLECALEIDKILKQIK